MLKIRYTWLIFFVCSCAQLPKPISGEQKQKILSDNLTKIDYAVSRQELSRDVRRAKSTLQKKEWGQADRALLEKLVLLYRGALALKEQKAALPPQSVVSIPLKSFCLDPNMSSPSDREPYFWKKQEMDLPVSYEAILKHASNSTSDKQSHYQEIIWNLRNRVRYEDYPDKTKSLLNEIDPNAKYKLPSRVKEVVVESAKSIVGSAGMNLSPFSENWSLVEGRYYDYADVVSAIEKRSSAKAASVETASLNVDGRSEVFTESASLGFSRQVTKFFNATDVYQQIDLSKYLLISSSKDVQRIGVYAQRSDYADLEKFLKDSLKDAIVRNSAYWYGGRLNAEEVKLIGECPLEALSVYLQAEKARFSVLKYFLVDGEDNESDAFRHFIWSGLVVQQLDEALAKRFMDAHESVGLQSKSIHVKRSSEMDLFNGQKGIDSAGILKSKDSLSWKKLEESGVEAIRQGKLKVIKPGQQVVYPLDKIP